MIPYQKFNNPPVIEAIFDIQCVLAGSVKSENLKELQKNILDEYPNAFPTNFFQVNIQMAPEKKPIASSTDLSNGIAFRNKNNTSLVQFRLNGFTFNKLKPYSDWDSVFAETKRLWKLYLENIKPISITRLGLRYINIIDIPAEKFDLESYFSISPNTPEAINRPIDSFLSRISIVYDEDIKGFLTLATQPVPPNSKNTPIYFDIEIFKPISTAMDEPTMWKTFEEFRKIRNDMFFNSLNPEINKVIQ